MFNYDYGYVNGLDDTDLRNFDADTGSIADHGPMTIERAFLLDHFRRLFWTGRLYVDPKPSTGTRPGSGRCWSWTSGSTRSWSTTSRPSARATSTPSSRT